MQCEHDVKAWNQREFQKVMINSSYKKEKSVSYLMDGKKERLMRSYRFVFRQDRISASLTQARRNLKHRESELSDKKVQKLQEDVRLNVSLLHNSKQLWRRLKLRSRGCSHRCLGGGLLLPTALLRLAAVMASPASSSTAATLASEVTAGDSGSGNSSVVRKKHKNCYLC